MTSFDVLGAGKGLISISLICNNDNEALLCSGAITVVVLSIIICAALRSVLLILHVVSILSNVNNIPY